MDPISVACQVLCSNDRSCPFSSWPRDGNALTEIFRELGEKHTRYGVKPEFFPSMGRALMEAISCNLEEGEFEEVKMDWSEVYGALSYNMIRGSLMALNQE